MMCKIQIRNKKLPKEPRVFDVTVNEYGDIIRYDLQNIRGSIYIEDVDVKKQILEELSKKE